ncbi:YidC/Oxa1 family membrane protein insertase [Azohydromonas caseinilytica]|uniref:Sulfatase-like hydrolase/transferase n=1 Tax=Azohydromonas caseinilytica TaxID=2728836 RepID=A0A848FB41_9BURK|nr:YidC/Oxa1 family membrane protein insertase [Azohydromonas caseinilytica]NML16086.1 sulfatase-like hydrolase/transferase [Azohydromonas caseinilytica]
MLELLDTALIAPIRWALLSVLRLGWEVSGSHGLSLLILSVFFNLLLIPAYHWAERLQGKEREAQRRMRPKVEEFKAVFKGQELHMMLRQLYKLHGYHPIYALRTLAPLAIQIPFFIAAFGLLSHYAPFVGASFLFLRDLSRPDALLGGVHLMPLLMTAINLYALQLYARQTSRSDWAQGVVVALIFLVLLYDSPSGLVLYWTFNNLLSVLKSAWYTRRLPRGAAAPSHFTSLLREIGASLRRGRTQRLLDSLGASLKGSYALACASLFMLLVVALPIGFTSLEDNVDGLSGYVGFFLLASLAAAAVFALLSAAWYRLAGPALRAWTTFTAFAAMLLALAFAFVHQPDAGMLDNFVFFTPQALAPTGAKLVLDLALLIVLGALAWWTAVRYPAAMRNALAVMLLASVLSAGLSLVSLDRRIDQQLAKADPEGTKLFRYSKTQPNVLLVFLDGAMSGYLPAIFEDEPQLKEQLRGFSWYPNVISSGNRTINGLPSVFGGEDYTVGGVNARRNGTLKEKVTDGYKIYVDNFHAKGYDVQYADPFWFGLVRTGDCELFNELYAKDGKGRCIHSIGRGVERRKREVTADKTQDFFVGLARQYFALTVFRVAPHSLKNAVYDRGQWLSMSFAWKKRMDKYLNNFFSLAAMPSLSAVDSDRPTFNFITNEAPRATFLLDKDCLPEDARGSGSVRRESPRFRHEDTQRIFETHRCVMRGVGRFVDWLRAEGILDNTFIVFASDHGWVSDNPLLDGVRGQQTYSMYQAFLMVKDFNSRGELKEDPTYIANFKVPGLICDRIGGCLDHATGKTVRYEPLVPPVRLYETPWQPAGQTLHDYVIDAMHENSGAVGLQRSWRTLNGELQADAAPSPAPGVALAGAGLAAPEADR